MDLHQKQWTRQDESEEGQPQQYPSLKIPKLLQDHNHQQQQLHLHPPHISLPPSATTSTPLPLFSPEPNTSKFSNLSALARMGGNNYFSLAQWHELELQALIYRYMLAGATVPPELLQPIKKSLHVQSSPFFFHHPLQQYPFYQPSLLQTGYWGRAAMDPEPGRCRRTDGKKWRCSRDVVPGQKYCERHVHRGRNRSRKPVETPSSTIISTTTTSTLGTTGVASALNTTTSLADLPSALVADGSNSFSLSVHSPSLDVLHFSHSSLDSKIENKSFLGGPHRNEVSNRSDGHVLRHFFDDWPRSLEKPDNPPGNNGNAINSSTCLSISMPGNSSSDVSLKLATGITGDEPGPRDNGKEQPPLGWTSGWASAPQVASMGGPLAEALRSSTSNSSPTSVLHQIPRGSGSETSYLSS